MKRYEHTVTLKRTGNRTYAIITQAGLELIEFQSPGPSEAIEQAKVFISSWSSIDLKVDDDVAAR